MSRFRRIIHGTATGYAALVAASLYSLASVPLALHYLSKERFALWALMSSIGGYLNLIDFGMSSSVARLLIDHKDDREGGTYGSLLQTGCAVLMVQGAILLVLGLALASPLAGLLDIQPDLRGEFIGLMRWQSAALALSMALRISSQLLYAHQRMDIFNYLQMGTFVISFALQWLFFHAGQGVYSLAWASVLSVFCSSLVSAVLCWRMDLFPAAWGRPSWKYFGEIFGFGKDLFLVSVGTQMITATQTMIITRMLGLEAAALWSVGTRAFTLLSQMVYRITDVSGPALGEMIARGEEVGLRTRYKALIVLTGSLSGFAAVAYVLSNSSFVTLWTHGRFAWPPMNDVLLGVWLIILAVLHCHNTFVVLTKQIHFMRYIYFVEGLVFVTAALLVARWGGLAAVIACSIACSTAFSGAYSVWRASRYFDCSLYEVGFRWLAPMGRLLVFLIPLGVVGGWIAGRLAEPLGQLAFAVLHPGSASSAERAIAVAAARLVLNALLAGSGGCYLFLHYGLSHEVQRELLQRAPKRLNPVLRRVFVSSAQ